MGRSWHAIGSYLANLAKWPDIVDRVKRSYSIGEAKTQLSRLVAEAERGDEVELRRGKTPVARLVASPMVGAPRRAPGALAGQIELADDFDVLPDDVARALGIVD